MSGQEPELWYSAGSNNTTRQRSARSSYIVQGPSHIYTHVIYLLMIWTKLDLQQLLELEVSQITHWSKLRVSTKYESVWTGCSVVLLKRCCKVQLGIVHTYLRTVRVAVRSISPPCFWPCIEWMILCLLLLFQEIRGSIGNLNDISTLGNELTLMPTWMAEWTINHVTLLRNWMCKWIIYHITSLPTRMNVKLGRVAMMFIWTPKGTHDHFSWAYTHRHKDMTHVYLTHVRICVYEHGKARTSNSKFGFTNTRGHVCHSNTR